MQRETGHQPDIAKEERDCLCGNYPNGDCYICQGEQAKQRLKAASLGNKPSAEAGAQAEADKPKGIADDARWKELKKKLDIH